MHSTDGKCIHPLNGAMHGQAMVNTKLTAADCHPNQPDRIEFTMLQDVQDEGKKYFNIQHVGSSKCTQDLNRGSLITDPYNEVAPCESVIYR